MEYQRITNLLDDTANQPPKFRTRNWVQLSDESKGRCDNSNIRFKMSMIIVIVVHVIIVMDRNLLKEL